MTQQYLGDPNVACGVQNRGWRKSWRKGVGRRRDVEAGLLTERLHQELDAAHREAPVGSG